jgi:DtxR family transcriptional regulator, Mn-dependent transcriptional regulator
MSRSEKTRGLSAMKPGQSGKVVRIQRDNPDRADRLMALGVTPGAKVTVLQRFPGVVFLCDETELAVEPAVARAIVVELE